MTCPRRGSHAGSQTPKAGSFCLIPQPSLRPHLPCTTPCPQRGAALAETSRSLKVQGQGLVGTTPVICPPPRPLCQETHHSGQLSTHSLDTDEAPGTFWALDEDPAIGQDVSNFRAGMLVSLTPCCPLGPRRVPGTRQVLSKCWVNVSHMGAGAQGSVHPPMLAPADPSLVIKGRHSLVVPLSQGMWRG